MLKQYKRIALDKGYETDMSENAIEVRNLKLYYRSMQAYSIRDNLFRLKKNQKEIFEALKGISFDVPKGQILGIIGENGSGKSTLLRTIGGIFSPDEGSVKLFNHTISLLSIGVGFQPQQTGRTNIMLSGLLLGFSEEQVRERMEEIIDFAGLGGFIDRPVKTYSSGMYSKLAFSITAVLETDIILIDEVLSVGDEQFKKKSFQKMKELISDENRTVILVSHSLGAIQELCHKVLWLHQGELKMLGEPCAIIAEYRNYRK